MSHANNPLLLIVDDSYVGVPSITNVGVLDIPNTK